MSIYNQAEYARRMLRHAAVILSTTPKASVICAYNHNFPNQEHVWRWEQVMRLIWRFDDVMIHVPDYYVKDFYKDISSIDCARLRKVKCLAINIMNQNIDLMPEPEVIAGLRTLTFNLSQTCAHTKYNGQEYANRFDLRTLYLPAYWRMDLYRSYQFHQKKKRICYSPDYHPRREEIVEKLRCDFPDFEVAEIHDLTFPQFMEYVARSYCVITFGEGLDGYYSIPLNKRTMSFTVYNDRFFTKGIDWKNVWNVFTDYDDMANNISRKIKECIINAESYSKCLDMSIEPIKHILKNDAELNALFCKQFHRFYSGDFDYYPEGWHA